MSDEDYDGLIALAQRSTDMGSALVYWHSEAVSARAERDALRERAKAAESVKWGDISSLVKVQAEADALREQVEAARLALTFYADHASYNNPSPRHVRPVIADEGRTARRALARLDLQERKGWKTLALDNEDRPDVRYPPADLQEGQR